MRGSPEHLLLQETGALSGGRGQPGQEWDPGETKIRTQRRGNKVRPGGGKEEKEVRVGTRTRLDPEEAVITTSGPRRLSEEGRKHRIFPGDPGKT